MAGMALDLHRVLVRKQERESAKADDFAFRVRARTMRLFGEWLGDRVAAPPDPYALVRAIVAESDEAILDRLLDEHGGDGRRWRRAFQRLQAQATAELRAEVGDPSPHRLA